MFFKNFLKEYKFLIVSFLLIFLAFIYSLNIYLYVYDGHHHGLMLSNAQDLLKGKAPYKEIFIQYGILTTFLHSLVINFFGNHIFSINVFTTILYLSSIFFISLTVKKLTNYLYGLLSIFIILAHHPIPWLPWSNYVAFFFISLGIYFFQSEKSKFHYIAGFFFGLSCLSRENYFIFIFPFFLTFVLTIILFKNNERKFLYKKTSIFLLGFISPIIIFFFYLSFYNLFVYWKDYLILPFIYIERYETSIFLLVQNFITFFLTSSFFKFITDPQYVLISIILITNTLFIFYHLFFSKKINFNLIFISLLCVFSSVVSINIELFRLYTSVIFGLISLLILINKTKNNELKNFFLFFIIFISLFSIFFYPEGNNKIFKNLNKVDSKKISEIPYFKFQRWEEAKINPLLEIYHIQKKIKTNCNIEYAANFTFDAFYFTILELDNIHIVPMTRAGELNEQHYLSLFKKRSIYKNLKKELMKKNIILLISENNYFLDGKEIVFDKTYTNKEIKLHGKDEKPKILRIYYPKHCLF
tara:strand:+ start:4931 stop:6514 length:1584 start_codon:yes stop_codon:yes gene_type:complete